MRKLIHELLLLMRQTALRRPILRILVGLHNFAYHMISFFASSTGTHPKHEILQYHKFFVENIRAGDEVLDVGCGHGEVSFDVAQKAAKVVGIDISPKHITIAQKKYQWENLEFVVGDAITYHWSQTFDVVILSNVLEHIKQRPEFLRRLARVAPKILIRVPMLTRDWLTVYKKNEGLEYRLDNTHYIEYTLEDFRREMALADLEIVQCHINFGELYAVTRAHRS